MLGRWFTKLFNKHQDNNEEETEEESEEEKRMHISKRMDEYRRCGHMNNISRRRNMGWRNDFL